VNQNSSNNNQLKHKIMTEKAKKIGEASAYPEAYTNTTGEIHSTEGLTRREYFAAMALQGLHLMQYPDDKDLQATAKAAVKYADALLEELLCEN
jgi:hypothetical protein